MYVMLCYISCIGIYRPKVMVWRRFGLKTGIDFAHFGLKSGMGNYDSVRMCLSFQL